MKESKIALVNLLNVNQMVILITSLTFFTDVYLSLNDAIIPKNSYVGFNDIGSTENTALICNTNRPVINIFNKRHSGGDWYGPSGTRVGNMACSRIC